MKISSNYNLSFNTKTNNKKSKTNPNFGINTKNLTLPLAAGTGAIYGVAHKLMPLPPAGLFLATQVKPDGKNKYFGLTNLPADESGYTKLHHLCKDGDFNAVKKFLDENPNINLSQRDKGNFTYMSFAIYSRQEDIINLIAGMDNYNPTVPDKDGWTDLHRLCEYGYTDVVKNLLEKHPEFDINLQTKNGHTCMSLAIKNGHKRIINLLANMDKYNPANLSIYGVPYLHILCSRNYTDAVKTLLEKHPDFDINQQNKDGKTCMSIAIDKQHKDIINLIAGMDNYNPTVPDKDGWTDLHRLCMLGYTEVVKTLLEKHPEFDINLQSENGYTCMRLAGMRKLDDIVKLIANMDKYNPTIPNKYGYTDLHYLCNGGYTDTVKTLLEKHPEFDINLQTENGSTCMSLAVYDKHDDTVNLIAGMDSYNPTIPDIDGWTDLHWLCRNGYTDVVKTLLEKYPDFDINQQTENGNTCMSIAIDFNQIDIINLIAGMDKYNPAIPNKNGWTDLHSLCKKGYTDAIKTLLEKHPDIDFSQQTKDGDTCMSLAIKNNQEGIINLIAGTDNYKPDMPGKDGWTDLHRLCDSNYTEAIEIILKNKPDVNINQFTGDGYSCMTIALANKNKNLVNSIAGFKNYNPLIINKFGTNDLHYLCREGYTEAVKTILDNNPDIDLNQLTKDGLSYIELAKSNNYTDIVKILCDRL